MLAPLLSTEIAAKRRRLKLTQARLARLSHVTPNTISRFELGVHNSLPLRVVCTYILDCIESGQPISDDYLRSIVSGGAA